MKHFTGARWHFVSAALGAVGLLLTSVALLLPPPQQRASKKAEPGANLGPDVRLPGARATTRVQRSVYKVRNADVFPVEENYGVFTSRLPDLKPNEVLIRTRWLSVDPYMRRFMGNGGQLLPVVGPDDPDAGPQLRKRVIGGTNVGVVAESRAKSLPVGSFVRGDWKWQDSVVRAASSVERLREYHEPLSAALGTLGLPGRTAYYGVFEVLRPQPGEVLFVSGAAGAVGVVVGQLGKIAGCRVIGSAGTPEKVLRLHKLGFDGVFNYRTEDPTAALRRLAPNGIDLFFENTGGPVSEAVVHQLNDGARVAISGLIEWYHNRGNPLPKQLRAMLPSSIGAAAWALLTPWSILKAAAVKRLVHLQLDRWHRDISKCDRGLLSHQGPALAGVSFTTENFLVTCFDKLGLKNEAESTMARYMREGRLKHEETVLRGEIEDVPRAFISMLGGGNWGKQVVEINTAGSPPAGGAAQPAGKVKPPPAGKGKPKPKPPSKGKASPKATVQDACECRNWKSVYERQQAVCGQAAEILLLTGTTSLPRSEVRRLMSAPDRKFPYYEFCESFFQRLDNNYCTNIAIHEWGTAGLRGGVPATSKWCYVSNQCKDLQGGRRIPGSMVEGRAIPSDLSWKVCTPGQDTMLGDLPPDKMLDLANSMGSITGFATKMAWPRSPVHWAKVRDLWWSGAFDEMPPALREAIGAKKCIVVDVDVEGHEGQKILCGPEHMYHLQHASDKSVPKNCKGSLKEQYFCWLHQKVERNARGGKGRR